MHADKRRLFKISVHLRASASYMKNLLNLLNLLT